METPKKISLEKLLIGDMSGSELSEFLFNLLKENMELGDENSKLKYEIGCLKKEIILEDSKENKPICDADDYIVYVKKCKTGRMVGINGTAPEIANSIHQIISRFSEASGLSFNLILSAVSMAQNIFGKGE